MPESYLLCTVAGATYAVHSDQIQVVEMVSDQIEAVEVAEKITRVPNAPDFVEGVTTVRGQVIPVVSMRRRFHMEPGPIDLRSRLIVIRLDERLIGMLVDSAREFVRINPDQIKSPPETLTGRIVDYLDGVISQPNRLILIINLRRLFAEDEQVELEQGSFLKVNS